MNGIGGKLGGAIGVFQAVSVEVAGAFHALRFRGAFV
jgi:hypothetical protein